MPIRPIALALLLAPFSLPALAGNSVSDLNLPNMLVVPKASGASCAVLQRQLNDAIVTHASAPRLASAQAYALSGERKCNAGNYADGVKDLNKGLKALKLPAQMP
jgi:hypothetical protein